MENFLQIRNEEIDLFIERDLEEVRETVDKRVHTAELWGSVLELFLTRPVDTMSVMMGGENPEDDTDYLTVEEGGGLDEDPPQGPGSFEDFFR